MSLLSAFRQLKSACAIVFVVHDFDSFQGWFATHFLASPLA